MAKEKRSKMISVRASEEEIRRVKDLAAALIEKNPHLKEANILRELLGLVDSGLITREMRWKLSQPALEPSPLPGAARTPVAPSSLDPYELTELGYIEPAGDEQEHKPEAEPPRIRGRSNEKKKERA
jgi:hypothetical protein